MQQYTVRCKECYAVHPTTYKMVDFTCNDCQRKKQGMAFMRVSSFQATKSFSTANIVSSGSICNGNSTQYDVNEMYNQGQDLPDVPEPPTYNGRSLLPHVSEPPTVWNPAENSQLTEQEKREELTEQYIVQLNEDVSNFGQYEACNSCKIIGVACHGCKQIDKPEKRGILKRIFAWVE